MADKRVKWPPSLSAYEAFTAADKIYKSYGKSVNTSLLGEVMNCKVSSSNFPRRLSALQTFGLANIDKGKLHLTPLGLRIVAPVNPRERALAKFEAFNNAEILNKLADLYPGGHLPSGALLDNLLKRDFDISNEAMNAWADFIVDSFSDIADYWGTTSDGDKGGNPLPPPPPNLQNQQGERDDTETIRIDLKNGRYIAIPKNLSEDEFHWLQKWFEVWQQRPE